MDKETRDMFNMVIGEIDKLAERMDSRFEKMDKKIDAIYENLSHEINACKLNNDSLALVVQKTDELDKRVSTLEQKKRKKQNFRLL